MSLERNEIPCLDGAGKIRPFGEWLRDSRSSSASARAVTVNCESESEEPIIDSRLVDKVGSSAKVSVNSSVFACADALDVDSMVDIKTLFEGRVHLGHKHGCWNPIMKPYIYGRLHDVHIFDLDTTLTLMKLALKVAGVGSFSLSMREPNLIEWFSRQPEKVKSTSLLQHGILESLPIRSCC